MGAFKVTGGVSLSGSIQPQGAKNEALQILCAVLLTPEPVTIHNIPNIIDVNKLIQILEKLGVKMTTLTDEQAEYLNLSKEGPFKPDAYRY